MVVDLDGSLIQTDLLLETASRHTLERPLQALRLLAWTVAGKATLKARLAQASAIDASTLPYNTQLLHWLRQEKARGRTLVLATGSHRLLAEQVAAHLGLFDTVLATDDVNLRAVAKRDALVHRFGERGFDYVGNEAADLPVWRAAALAHVVGNSPALLQAVRQEARMGRHFSTAKPPLPMALLRAARPHQWVKNLLVLVALMTAHRYGDANSVLHALLALVAFCLVSSSVYVLNDLADVHQDRRHRSKRRRPFAAGHLALTYGWLAWPTLLALGMGLAWAWLPTPFIMALTGYCTLSLAYCLRLRRVPVVDVLTLAALYTVRIVAGAFAIGVAISFWLLAFSMFLFFSLALLKRYSELRTISAEEHAARLEGRGYLVQDTPIVGSLGCCAGLIAVLVLALYIQEGPTARWYAMPELLWLACPAMLYWVSRIWLLAHRGQVDDDPIVFAIQDRASWAVLALLVLIFLAARAAA